MAKQAVAVRRGLRTMAMSTRRPWRRGERTSGWSGAISRRWSRTAESIAKRLAASNERMTGPGGVVTADHRASAAPSVASSRSTTCS